MSGDYAQEDFQLGGLRPFTFATTRLDTKDSYENIIYYIIHFTNIFYGFSNNIFTSQFRKMRASLQSHFLLTICIKNLSALQSWYPEICFFYIKDSFAKKFIFHSS